MAEDLWSEILHEASFGGIRLDVQSMRDQLGRALVRHTYAHRDGADLEDMGAEPRTTSCRVVFARRGAGDNPAERFAFFHAQAATGDTKTFTHPIFGSYPAKVGQLEVEADFASRDLIVADVTFEEDTTEPAVFDVGPGTPLTSGAEEVGAAAAEADAALVQASVKEGVPLTTTVTADARAATSSWESDLTRTVRDVNLELVNLANQIDRETRRLELAMNLKRWPILASFTRLQYAIRRAAAVFTQRTPRIIEITVSAPTPLLIVAARTYGADQAQARYHELLRLNDLRNPARIEAGTVLKAQSPGGPRTTLRSPV